MAIKGWLKISGLILVYLCPNLALAYQKPPMTFITPDPAKQALEIGKNKDLKYTRLEIDTKNELIRMRLFKPKEFFQLKNNHLENTMLLQSYIDEVDEAFWGFSKKIASKARMDYFSELMKGKPIDTAKKIAKQQMLNHILRNWSELKETIFNEAAVESWDRGGKVATIQNLNKSFVYVPQHGPNFLFKFGDSFVEIDKKTLKRGTIGIDVNSRFDKNKISPEAQNIVADDDGMPKARAKRSESSGAASAPEPEQSGAPTYPSLPQENPQAPPPPIYQGTYPGGYPGSIQDTPPPPPYEPGFDLNGF